MVFMFVLLIGSMMVNLKVLVMVEFDLMVFVEMFSVFLMVFGIFYVLVVVVFVSGRVVIEFLVVIEVFGLMLLVGMSVLFDEIWKI